MQSPRAAGLLLGLLGAAFFGFIPVFVIPLLRLGYSAETAVFYRFALGALILAPCLIGKGPACSLKTALGAMTVAIFYFLDVTFFFHALKYLSGGIVATLEFLCPVFTAGMMVIFFHQKFHWLTGAAIFFAFIGVGLLSAGADGGPDNGQNWTGVLLSLLAAFCNALYYVGFKWLDTKNHDALQITFFVMLSCSLCCLASGAFSGNLQWIGQKEALINALLLALVTAVLSNVCLIAAIRKIGPGPVSILGVMEPVTAVLAGMIFLNEQGGLTVWLGLGCSIIAVLCAMLPDHQ